MELALWRHCNAATLAGPAGWGWIDDAALVCEGEALKWIGPLKALPRELRPGIAKEHDLAGACVTPGLVDCHTHLVYGGERSGEFEQRLQGASYEEIARAGGGIRSTVRATREASDDQLFEAACRRARQLQGTGVTTVEIKSGYGLSLADEARCLRVARRIGRELPITVRTTFLGAHAVAPEHEGRPDDHIEAVCRWMAPLKAEGLVDAVDAFCDRIGFTREQTRRVFEAAKALGLPVKLHAEQLSDQQGAELAADFGALSCDHLEHLGEAGVQAMAKAATVAVLLPGAYYFLRDTQPPPVELLRRHGVPMAVATDHNPGSSPALSLPLMVHMACSLFRLTPEEAVRGATVNAARALGLSDRGALAGGLRADFVAWDLGHPRELAYWFGLEACREVVAGGRAVNLRRPARP